MSWKCQLCKPHEHVAECRVCTSELQVDKSYCEDCAVLACDDCRSQGGTLCCRDCAKVRYGKATPRYPHTGIRTALQLPERILTFLDVVQETCCGLLKDKPCARCRDAAALWKAFRLRLGEIRE